MRFSVTASSPPSAWWRTSSRLPRDWRSLELAMKAAAAKETAREAGPGVSAAAEDAQIRQARFDRFLSRVFAAGEVGVAAQVCGMSMLAWAPAARTTKDMDLAEPGRRLPEHPGAVEIRQRQTHEGPRPVGCLPTEPRRRGRRRLDHDGGGFLR